MKALTTSFLLVRLCCTSEALHAVTHLTEGDIVEYVLEGFKQVNMGMVVEDSTDGEVKVTTRTCRSSLSCWLIFEISSCCQVRKLLRRDGDGEFDEWRCVVAKTEAVVEVADQLLVNPSDFMTRFLSML